MNKIKHPNCVKLIYAFYQTNNIVNIINLELETINPKYCHELYAL